MDDSRCLRDKILAILGIDPMDVLGVELKFRRGKMPTVVIERAVSAEEVQRIVGVMDTFVLIPELKCREPVTEGGK